MANGKKHGYTDKLIRIEVTQNDLDVAQRNNSRHCAVAMALQRVLPEAECVSVDIQSIRFSLPSVDRRFFYLTPPVAQAAIVAFDAGDPLEPFSFTLLRYAPAYSIKRRHRQLGPYKQDLITRLQVSSKSEKGMGSQTLIVKGRKSIPEAARKRGGSQTGAYRTYGMRAMRINQQFNLPKREETNGK